MTKRIVFTLWLAAAGYIATNIYRYANRPTPVVVAYFQPIEEWPGGPMLPIPVPPETGDPVPDIETR